MILNIAAHGLEPHQRAHISVGSFHTGVVLVVMAVNQYVTPEIVVSIVVAFTNILRNCTDVCKLDLSAHRYHCHQMSSEVSCCIVTLH